MQEKKQVIFEGGAGGGGVSCMTPCIYLDNVRDLVLFSHRSFSSVYGLAATSLSLAGLRSKADSTSFVSVDICRQQTFKTFLKHRQAA